MINFSDVAIYLHRDYVDFRKQINGLASIVQGSMHKDIFDASLYVFCNKKRDKLKIIYWDKTGFCLWQKRLEKAKFSWPKKHDASIILWNIEQLNWLLRGFDVSKIKAHKQLKYKAI